MKTTVEIILQISISIILFCFSYGIKKRKLNLLTNSGVFLFLQLLNFTLFYWDFKQGK